MKCGRGVVGAVMLAAVVVAMVVAPASAAAQESTILSLRSSSHPVPAAWYPNPNPALAWVASIPTSLTGARDTPGYATGVAVARGYAFVADVMAGLQVVDLTDPALPVIVGQAATPGDAWDVAVAGDYAYVAANAAGVQVVDITDPANPSVVGSYDTPGESYSIAVVGTLAFVGDRNGGLQIIDIQDPLKPSLVGQLATSEPVWDVSATGGSYVYLAAEDAGLLVVDVSDPTQPSVVGSRAASDHAWGVTQVGNYAYLSIDTDGVAVVDVSNKADPTIVSTIDTPGLAWDLTTAGTFYLFVADDTGGLQIVNVVDAANPVIVGSYDTTGNVCAALYVAGQTYVADGGEGLAIISCDVPNAYSYILDQDVGTSPDTVSEGSALGTSYTGVADGLWYFHVRARTLAGTWGPVAHRAVRIDTVAPGTTDNSDSSWHAGNVNVTLAPSDAGAGVVATYYRLNGGSWKQGTSVAVGPRRKGSYSGRNVVTYYSVDAAGNAEAEKTCMVKIDVQAPYTASDADGGVYGAPVTITLFPWDGGSGVAGTWYRVDGGSWQVGTSVNILAPLDHSNDGLHVIDYYSVDNLGNTETVRSGWVTIDT